MKKASSKATAKPQSSTAEQPRYFNQYANGIGYINAIRTFGGDEQPVRHAIHVSVLQGPADNVHYEHHDLIVGSQNALDVLLQHSDAIESVNAKVLMRFTMANPRAKAFVYQQGDRAGQAGAAISGFLTRILSLKIDGELVHEDLRTFDDVSNASEAAQH